MNGEMDDFLLYISSLKSRSNLLIVHPKHWLSKRLLMIFIVGVALRGARPLVTHPYIILLIIFYSKRLKLAKQHSAQKTKNMSKLSSLKTMPKSLLTEYSHSMPIVGANLQIFSSDEGPSTTASGGDGASASER